MARRKAPKNLPKPKKMKHRSSYASKQTAENSVVVQGETEGTTTGGVIMGTKCKGYEQYYEFMDPGAATALLSHAKKTRTIMVIAGAGFAAKATDEEEGSGVEQPLKPGDVVEFPPGVEYRITATATQQLEFFVVQEKAYFTHMKATGEAIEGQEPLIDETPETVQTREYTESVARDRPIPRRDRRMSKASQQNQRFRGQTNAGVHITRLLGSQAAAHTGSAGVQATNNGASHSTGVNPQPTHG